MFKIISALECCPAGQHSLYLLIKQTEFLEQETMGYLHGKFINMINVWVNEQSQKAVWPE